MKVAPAIVIGLIALLAGLVVGYAGAGLKMGTQTQTTTSVNTTIQTLFSTVTTTAVGNIAPEQHPSYFISLAGVSGEASVLNYTGLIKLKAWDWGPPSTACAPAGGPGGGPCNTMETSLNFNATSSKASVTFQMDASQGTPIPTGTLIGVASIGGQQTVVAKYDFTNLLISSYSTDSHGTLPVDVAKLVFQSVTVVV